MIGLPFAFSNTLMSVGWEDQWIGFPQVAETLATSVRWRDALPKHAASLLAAISNGIGNNLAGATTQDCPNPAFSPVCKHKGPHFVDFENIFSLCRQERLFNFWILLVFF
jgi:hypothetical protein